MPSVLYFVNTLNYRNCKPKITFHLQVPKLPSISCLMCAYTWRYFFFLHSYLCLTIGMIHVLDLCYLLMCYYRWPTFLIMCFFTFLSCDISKSFSIILCLYYKPGLCNWKGTQHCSLLVVVTCFFLHCFLLMAFCWSFL